MPDYFDDYTDYSAWGPTFTDPFGGYSGGEYGDLLYDTETGEYITMQQAAQIDPSAFAEYTRVSGQLGGPSAPAPTSGQQPLFTIGGVPITAPGLALGTTGLGALVGLAGVIQRAAQGDQQSRQTVQRITAAASPQERAALDQALSGLQGLQNFAMGSPTSLQARLGGRMPMEEALWNTSVQGLAGQAGATQRMLYGSPAPMLGTGGQPMQGMTLGGQQPGMSGPMGTQYAPGMAMNGGNPFMGADGSYAFRQTASGDMQGATAADLMSMQQAAGAVPLQGMGGANTAPPPMATASQSGVPLIPRPTPNMAPRPAGLQYVPPGYENMVAGGGADATTPVGAMPTRQHPTMTPGQAVGGSALSALGGMPYGSDARTPYSPGGSTAGQPQMQTMAPPTGGGMPMAGDARTPWGPAGQSGYPAQQGLVPQMFGEAGQLGGQQTGILNAAYPTLMSLAGGQIPQAWQSLVQQAYQPAFGDVATQAIESARNRGFAGGADLLNSGPGGAIAGPALAALQGQQANSMLGLLNQYPNAIATASGAYSTPLALRGQMGGNLTQLNQNLLAALGGIGQQGITNSLDFLRAGTGLAGTAGNVGAQQGQIRSGNATSQTTTTQPTSLLDSFAPLASILGGVGGALSGYAAINRPQYTLNLSGFGG